MYPVSSYAGGAQAKVYDAALKAKGVSKVALLTINVPVGVDAAKFYTDAAAADGIQVVSNELYAPTQTGYVSKALSAGAQAVLQFGGTSPPPPDSPIGRSDRGEPHVGRNP